MNRNEDCPRIGASRHRRKSLEERFWEKVNKNGDGECWIWAGCINSTGYGAMKVNGKTKRAHILSYEMAHPGVVIDRDVCHKCDNPLCVNPNHLFLATHAENMRDKMSKGRGGDTGKSGVLTENDVRDIRWLKEHSVIVKDIAAAYGISMATVRNVASRRTQTNVV